LLGLLGVLLDDDGVAAGRLVLPVVPLVLLLLLLASRLLAGALLRLILLRCLEEVNDLVLLIVRGRVVGTVVERLGIGHLGLPARRVVRDLHALPGRHRALDRAVRERSPGQPVRLEGEIVAFAVLHLDVPAVTLLIVLDVGHVTGTVHVLDEALEILQPSFHRHDGSHATAPRFGLASSDAQQHLDFLLTFP
jgi:hypothetical protein